MPSPLAMLAQTPEAQDLIQQRMAQTRAQTTALSDASQMLVNEFDDGAGATLESQVIDAATPTIDSVTGELDEASAAAGRQSDVAEGVFGRRLRGLGIQQTDREQRVASRRFGLSRALSSVNAQTRRQRAIQSRTDVARSAAGGLRDLVLGQEFGLRRGLSQAEGNRLQQHEAERAQHSANRRSTIGSFVGLAFGAL